MSRSVSVNSGDQNLEFERRDKLWSDVFASYNLDGLDQHELDAKPPELERLESLISAGLSDDEGACLICLESIARNEAVWSCSECYDMYHIVCIQRWIKDGVRLAEYHAEIGGGDAVGMDGVDLGKGKKQQEPAWCCPKCRKEYPGSSVPRKYYCFCGAVLNPKDDPWTLPHGCNGVCGHSLGECDHKCLILCHPGPCPPCPKILKVRCYCGKGGPVARRCGVQGWSCGKPCSRALPCRFHLCPSVCHPGPCPPCSERSLQPCVCGKRTQDRECAAGPWQCGQKCGRMLECGRHKCEVVCHRVGECPPCVPVGERLCPCGKTEYEVINCRDEQPTCMDTCGKLLDCGLHNCYERCHKGSCPPCNGSVEKRCRCGAKQKVVPCGKDYTCEIKCKQKRNCGRHPCNKKCCDGQCPPCEQPCNRPLQCGNHKCSSVCHTGMCYPCPLVVEVPCRCGFTKLKVPCGKEKRTKPPRCRKDCAVPPDCHHAARDRHYCHFDRCPPCQQTCEKILKCKHSCAQPCHSAVLTDVNALKKNEKPAGPWDTRAPKLELVALPCPPCRHPVPVTCLGGHETVDTPCSDARVTGCGRPCNAPLACGNHRCQRPCHSLTKQPCEDCESRCDLKRPDGCQHECTRPCHAPPCPPCRLRVREACHCGLSPQYIACSRWNDPQLSDAEREKLLCCGDRCPRLMAKCGHRCTVICHPGPCPAEQNCTNKVPVFCKCKNIKVMAPCSSAGGTRIECDQSCEDAKNNSSGKASSDSAALERERKRREAEELERKFGNGARSRKKKKPSNLADDSTLWDRHKTKIIICLTGSIALVLAVILTRHVI